MTLTFFKTAFLVLAHEAKEENQTAGNPCPDYAEYIASQIEKIGKADSLSSLAAIHFIESIETRKHFFKESI